jgi:capsular polysaccharide biosynthesis protein
MTAHQLTHIFDLCRPGGAIDFVLIEPTLIRVPEPPRFFFGNFSDRLSEHYFKMTHVHPMGVFVCRHTTVTAPYLITHDTALLVCPETNIHQAHLELILDQGHLDRPKNRRRVDGDCAMIYGPGYKIFGHWLVDFLPQIYLLQQAGYDVTQLMFLFPSDLPVFALELLELAGISRNNIVQFLVDTESVLCERLLIPTTCHNGLMFARLFRDGMAWLRQQIEAHSGSFHQNQSLERIFISRAHAHAGNRTLTNRADIEAMAVADGFVLVYPEELPLFRQFAVFAGAHRIIGEYGSALHSAMFSQAGTVICALRGDGVHPGFAQSGIATALGHHTGYVIGPNLPDSWDFTIDPGDFAAALRCISGAAPLGLPGMRRA